MGDFQTPRIVIEAATSEKFGCSERKQGFSAEQVLVSAYGGISKNLKDLKDSSENAENLLYMSGNLYTPTLLPSGRLVYNFRGLHHPTFTHT